MLTVLTDTSLATLARGNQEYLELLKNLWTLIASRLGLVIDICINIYFKSFAVCKMRLCWQQFSRAHFPIDGRKADNTSGQ